MTEPNKAAVQNRAVQIEVTEVEWEGCHYQVHTLDGKIAVLFDLVETRIGKGRKATSSWTLHEPRLGICYRTSEYGKRGYTALWCTKPEDIEILADGLRLAAAYVRYWCVKADLEPLEDGATVIVELPV